MLAPAEQTHLGDCADGSPLWLQVTQEVMELPQRAVGQRGGPFVQGEGRGGLTFLLPRMGLVKSPGRGVVALPLVGCTIRCIALCLGGQPVAPE